MNEDDLMTQAFGELTPNAPSGELEPWEHIVARAGRVHRRRNAQRATAAIVTVAALVLALVLMVARTDDRSLQTVTSQPSLPTQRWFDITTGSTLLIDDGYDGIIAIDVDRGVAQRFAFESKTPGSFRNRMLVVGDRIVFPGIDGLVSLPASFAGPPVQFGGQRVEVVAAGTSGKVWAVGLDTHRAVQFDPTTGRSSVTLPAGPDVVAGTADSVLFIDGQPPSLLQATQEGTPAQADPTEAAIEGWDARCNNVYPTGDTIWIAKGPLGQCTRLVALGEGARGKQPIDLPAPGMLVAFSPDGKRVASAPTNPGGKPVVIEAGTTRLTDSIPADALRVRTITWTPDGQKLFVVRTDDADTTRLGVYDLATDRYQERPIPFAGAAIRDKSSASVVAAVATLPSANGPQLRESDRRCALAKTATIGRNTQFIFGLPPGPCSLLDTPPASPGNSGTDSSIGTDQTNPGAGQRHIDDLLARHNASRQPLPPGVTLPDAPMPSGPFEGPRVRMGSPTLTGWVDSAELNQARPVIAESEEPGQLKDYLHPIYKMYDSETGSTVAGYFISGIGAVDKDLAESVGFDLNIIVARTGLQPGKVTGR